MKSVLIVDDDKFTRTVLKTIFSQDHAFKQLEFEIRSAEDGERGLALFRELKPAMVLVDLLMPKMDGFALCKAIRDEPEGKKVHLVVMSGIYRDSAIAHRVRNEYNAEFFAKPYQLKELTQHVAKLLTQGSSAKEATAGPPPIPPEAAPPLEQGDLAERPLPAVLFDLMEAKSTGQLVLRRGGVEKSVELVYGHPASVASSARDEVLGHFLVSRGVITEKQNAEAVKRASHKDGRVGEALIEMGALTHEDLLAHLTAQTRHKISQSLRWSDGTYEFRAHTAAPNATRGDALDTVAVVLEALRDSASLSPLPMQLRSIEERPLNLNARGERLMPRIGQLLSDKFADTWSQGITVQQLIDSGVDRIDAYAIVEVLLLCDAVVAEESPLGQATVSTDHASPVSVRDLSEHLLQRANLRPSSEHQEQLYSMLFSESTSETPLPSGEEPIELADGVPGEAPQADSGYIDIRDVHRAEGRSAAVDPKERATKAARKKLLQEYLRVQGLDHYGVLDVPPNASAAQISAAVAERQSSYSRDWFARFDLGRDYAKLEQLHAAYELACETLLDDEKRRSYDEDGAEGMDAASENRPLLEAEIAFTAGNELLEKGNYPLAIAKYKQAIEKAPNEASFHAALGWAYFLKGRREPAAADAARPHLNRALAVNPDHAGAHEYKGIIGAAIGTDDTEARFHLERALEADPTREDALQALEEVWARSGEARPLERLYRRLIYRTSGKHPEIELRLWLKLAELYRSQLDDGEGARVAYKAATALAPDDPAIQAALADLDTGSPDRFYERSEMLRGHWRRDAATPGPGVELLRAAQQAGRHDAAFMAASALVARGMATEEANELYRRYRPRFVLRAQQQLERSLWNRVRHPDDKPEVAELFDLIAPAAARAMPLELADLEIDESMDVDDAALPRAFVRMRAYVAHMLMVPPPRVFVRPDFGHQVHVGAIDPPVLLSGDGALAAPERSELSFRLGRAMTYLSPGRALGGSRPSRFLRSCVLAAFTSAMPTAKVEDPDGAIAEVRAHLEVLPSERKDRIYELVLRLTRESPELNLSRWARALARTADRVGLLLCGDLPAAVRFSSDSGTDTGTDDLIDFAISASHLSARSQLGLSIDV